MVDTRKRMAASLRDVRKDTSTAYKRVKVDMVDSTAALANWSASVVANSVGVLAAAVGELIIWVVRRPLMTVLLALVVLVGFTVYQNLYTADGRSHIDWRAVEKDLWSYYDKARVKLHEFSGGKVELPAFASSRQSSFIEYLSSSSRRPLTLDEPGGLRTVERSSFSEIRAQRLHDSRDMGQSVPVVPDRLGDFIKRLEVTGPHDRVVTYTVNKTAYRTAKSHGLAFAPGRSIDAILRGCQHLPRGAKVQFYLTQAGYVTGCRVVKGA